MKPEVLKNRLTFSRLWVEGFGWESTIYLPEDFAEVFEIGKLHVGGNLFIATFPPHEGTPGATVLLHGHYHGLKQQ